MQLLNVYEWLLDQRLQGQEFADELLDLLDMEGEYSENTEVWDDLHKAVPFECETGDKWRAIEWMNDRLTLLDRMENALELFRMDEIEDCEAILFRVIENQTKFDL